MKQLVILSGKGGTGKTSVAAAFAQLAHDGPAPIKTVLADADIDAANLELLLRPKRSETQDFTGGSLAVIDPELCQGCGLCEQACRFDAIIPPPEEDSDLKYTIDEIACEGCAACVYQCPEEAICMEPQTAGRWYRSDSRYGTLFHADLFPAQENSGKLVTLVKQNARLYALDNSIPAMIVDGPPGIGCPVIAAAAGASLAVIVAEPGVAGIHDLRRVLQTTNHIRIPSLVIINKADIDPKGTEEISTICAELNIDMIGHIPFDESITEAMVNGEPVTAYRPESSSSQAIMSIWQTVAARLELPGELNAGS